MEDEVLEEPPVKRLKLHQEDHIGHNSDTIQLSENTSVENTSTNSGTLYTNVCCRQISLDLSPLSLLFILFSFI
jgi:hypothetical protein